MAIMDPSTTYDYLTVARQRIFEWVRPLGPEAYARPLPNWSWTLARTLTHVMISEWYYVQRMERRDVPPYEQWPIQDEAPPPFATLESAWTEQAAATRAALSAVRDWSVEFEYRVTADDGRPMIVTASADGLFTQLILHEAHHRAQVMNMLRQLGVNLDDIDFNAVMFRRRHASPS